MRFHGNPWQVMENRRNVQVGLSRGEVDRGKATGLRCSAGMSRLAQECGL